MLLRNICFLMFVALTSSQSLTFDDAWAKLGEPTSLRCLATATKENVTACRWTTPYGAEHYLMDEFVAESHRLKGVVKTADECILEILKTEAKDEGEWKCQMRLGKDADNTIENTAQLKFAKLPTEVILENPFDSDTPKPNNDSSPLDFKCIVAKSNPKPNFFWFVNGETLSEDAIGDVKNEQNEENIVQILSYVPQVDHLNKTLKCKIVFDGVPETFEDEVVLAFTDEDLTLRNSTDNKDTDNAKASTSIIVTVVAVFVAILLAVFFIKLGKKPKQSKTEVDAEGGPPSGNDDKNSETEELTEKTDLTKEERESVPEAVKATLSERFATFFRLNQSLTKDTVEDVKEDGDHDKTPEVVVEDNQKEATEEETLEKSEVKKSENRLWTFFSKMFKPRDVVADKKGEEPVKMADCTDEENKDEDKPEVKVVEPEDKPDKPDEEENKPTPNTSF